MGFPHNYLCILHWLNNYIPFNTFLSYTLAFWRSKNQVGLCRLSLLMIMMSPVRCHWTLLLLYIYLIYRYRISIVWHVRKWREFSTNTRQGLVQRNTSIQHLTKLFRKKSPKEEITRLLRIKTRELIIFGKQAEHYTILYVTYLRLVCVNLIWLNPHLIYYFHG